MADIFKIAAKLEIKLAQDDEFERIQDAYVIALVKNIIKVRGLSWKGNAPIFEDDSIKDLLFDKLESFGDVIADKLKEQESVIINKFWDQAENLTRTSVSSDLSLESLKDWYLNSPEAAWSREVVFESIRKAFRHRNAKQRFEEFNLIPASIESAFMDHTQYDQFKSKFTKEQLLQLAQELKIPMIKKIMYDGEQELNEHGF